MVEKSTHQCEFGGLLVTPSDWLPLAKCEYNPTFYGVGIGCNQIHCKSCGEEVRAIVGYEIQESSAFKATELDAGHLAEIPWLKKDANSSTRLYYCECGFWIPQAWVSLDPVDSQSYERGFRFAWRCAGHPNVGEDLVVAGLPILSLAKSPETLENFMAATIRFLDSPATPNYPGFEIRRYYALLPDEIRAEFSLQVASYLTHPEPMFRYQAILFFHFFYEAAGVGQLVQAAIDHRDLFRGVPRPYFSSGTLEDVLFEALERRVWNVKDDKLIAFLRAELLSQSESDSLIQSLAKHDWDWLDENFPTILTKSPAQLENFIFELQGFPAEIIARFLKRISKLGIFDQAAIEGACEDVWPSGAAKHAEIFAAMGWE